MVDVVVAWVVLGIALVLFELHNLAFYALFLAVGSFAAAGVAATSPDAIFAQVAVAVLVAGAGVWFVRPALNSAYEKRHPHVEVARGVHGGLVGQEAMTLDLVGDLTAAGHVRLIGERWLAISISGPIQADTKVTVTDVRGTTLVVAPLDGR